MMEIAEVRKLLPVHADGGLDAVQAAEVDAHLVESAALRDELERWRALRRSVNRVLLSEPMPAALAARVQDALPRAAASRRGRVIRLFGAVTGIAAIVALALIIRPGLFGSSGGTATQATLVAASNFVKIHRNCGLGKHNPYPLGSDKLTGARTALAGAVDFDPVVPDLRDAGFEIEGCCTCATDASVASAHVYYRSAANPGQIVSFFSLDRRVRLKGGDQAQLSGVSGNNLFETGIVSDVTIVKWCGAARSYAFASEMKLDQLRNLAEQVDLAARAAAAPAFAAAE